MAINGLTGKVMIESVMRLKTGLHIGGGSGFSAIGAVDSTVIRDKLTREPYIPGSSLKGKLRYLMARVYAQNGMLCDIKEENFILKRLFGSSADDIVLSRLQFYDAFMLKGSKEKLKKIETDLYLSEIKFENTISRSTAVANPRQIERVPAGAEFGFKLAYNIEKEEELEEDMGLLGLSLSLIEDDYLGGHGTRGYGRIEFPEEFKFEYKEYMNRKEGEVDIIEKAKRAFDQGRKGEIQL